MKGKRRIWILGLLIFLCFLLQTTVLKSISFGSISPNLLIIVTSTIGFMRGKKEGMFVGFLCGLLIDIYSSKYIGGQALLYMIIGYVNGFFQRIFYDDDIKLPLGLLTGSELAYGFCMYFFFFFLRSKFNFFYYLDNIILPELVYTLLASLILYQIIRKINHWLETEEKRSGRKFV